MSDCGGMLLLLSSRVSDMGDKVLRSVGLPIKVQECGYRLIVEHEVQQYSWMG